MYLASNLKALRKLYGLTQVEVAEAMQIIRSTLGGYENDIAHPGYEMIIAFSEFYQVTVDDLLRYDLSKIAASDLSNLNMNMQDYLKGTKIRVLACIMDEYNNEMIEVVPLKAQAGYTQGYADTEFIGALPSFQIPFLSRDRKYRAFQINGDSMLPIKSGAYVIAEYVQNWYEVKDGDAYIILTKDDGIVFKIVYPAIKTKQKLLLKSLNPVFEPYEVKLKDVVELWKFTSYISADMPEPDITQEDLRNVVNQLTKDVKILKKSIKTH